MRAVAWRSWILVLAVGVGACTATPSEPSPSATPEPGDEQASPAATSQSPSPSASGAASIEDRAAAIIDIEGEPDWPAEAFGSLWVLAPDQETPQLVQIDPETNEAIGSVPLPGQICQGFVATDDAIWACVTDGVVLIDPDTSPLSIRGDVAFETGAAWGPLAFGSGSVWALGADGGVINQLVRIDPTALTATTIPLGHGSSTLAHGFDAVWVTAPQDGLLLRIDPGTGEVTEFVTGLARPQLVTVGPDSVWVTLQGAEEMAPDEPTVVRIDPNDGAILAEIPTGAAASHLWAGTDAVWVCGRDLFLARIDPATNEVIETLSGPPSTCAVAFGFDSVWATAGNALKVYRFEP